MTTITSLEELERLAWEFCDKNTASRDPFNDSDAMKARLFLGAFIIWLKQRPDVNVVQFDLRKEGKE